MQRTATTAIVLKILATEMLIMTTPQELYASQSSGAAESDSAPNVIARIEDDFELIAKMMEVTSTQTVNDLAFDLKYVETAHFMATLYDSSIVSYFEVCRPESPEIIVRMLASLGYDALSVRLSAYFNYIGKNELPQRLVNNRKALVRGSKGNKKTQEIMKEFETLYKDIEAALAEAIRKRYGDG